MCIRVLLLQIQMKGLQDLLLSSTTEDGVASKMAGFSCALIRDNNEAQEYHCILDLLLQISHVLLMMCLE